MRITSQEDVLTLSGDFDVRSTEFVRDAIYTHLARCGGWGKVDLSAVESIDLTALRVLVMASRYAAHHGGHLVLDGCTPAIRRLLHLSRLTRFVDAPRQIAS